MKPRQIPVQHGEPFFRMPRPIAKKAVDGLVLGADRGSNMFIYKALSAVAAAAFGAALVLAIPGFSPEVEARTPPPVVKADRIDIQPAAPACNEQAWPYYNASCLQRHSGQTRTVRLVTTDRVTR
jgi:hypothetical protein